MNTDQKLSRLLRQWTPSAELPPRFEAEVWRRISARKETIWDQLEAWLARPRLALKLSLGAILLGGGLGLWQAQAAYQRGMHQAEFRYLQAVDPLIHSLAANR